jgi:hypothetical protein
MAASVSTAFADSTATSQPSSVPTPWDNSPQLNGLPIPDNYPIDATLVPDIQTLVGVWRVDIGLSLTTLGHLMDQRDLDQLRELATMNGLWEFTFSEESSVMVRMQMGSDSQTQYRAWTFVSGTNNQITLTLDSASESIHVWFLDHNLCIVESSREGVMFYLRRVQD